MKKQDIITCDACGFQSEIEQWEPALTILEDIQCPKCRSKNNQHNIAYAADIQKRTSPATQEVQDKSIGHHKIENVEDWRRREMFGGESS